MSEENTPAGEQTFEATVNTHVNSMKQGEDGKFVMPEGLDEQTAYAVNTERRRRDTQAALATSKNQLTAAQAENTSLSAGWQKDITGSLTNDQAAELEELKATDQDAWRTAINKIEQDNIAAHGENTAKIKTEAGEQSELARRTDMLDAFNAANPAIAITDEFLANEVPPKFMKQLEKGEITFEDMLAGIKDYMGKDKVIKQGDKPNEDPSMEGGTATPTDAAVAGDIKKTYEKEVY